VKIIPESDKSELVEEDSERKISVSDKSELVEEESERKISGGSMIIEEDQFEEQAERKISGEETLHPKKLCT
jgi:hypothetical protein